MTAVNWKKLSWWVGVLVLLAALAAPELAAAVIDWPNKKRVWFNGMISTPKNIIRQ